jgi:two-component system, cell cycle response regulator
LSGVGDAVYTYQSLAGTYEAISWNNSLWPLGTVLIAVGALLPQPARQPSPQPESWRSFVTPAIFALAILTLLLLGSSSETDGVVRILTAATLVAVVGRLALTFHENRRLVSELKQDALTRLGNRSKLMVDLNEALRSDQRDPHVLMILDLDGFKSYNDAFGHPAGDVMLTRLARSLADTVDGRGSAYRLGGDEFAVLAPGDLNHTAPLIAAARVALSEHGEGFQVTSSLGAAELPREADTRSNALQLADRRMYDNKDSHRPSPGGEVEAVLVSILQQRAPELEEHGKAVTKLCHRVGAELGISSSEAAALARAAELHDIGKMAIPDAILNKATPLDEDEWEFMRQHTVLGERILSAAPSLAAVGAVVRSTHERWDGTGSPDGLAGEEIPLAARIVFVCDAYDAMVSNRPYARTKSHNEAMVELRACAGAWFDPAVVEAFCAAFPEAPPSDLAPVDEQGLNGAPDRAPLVE